MCMSDNPASRNCRKDTELWIVQGLHYLKSPVASRAAPGTEVSVLPWTQWEGSLWERGEEKVKRGCRKKKKSCEQYCRCLLTRWLGKLPKRRSQFYLLPNSQYERVRSSLGDKLRRTTLQVYQKAQGVARGHRLNIWIKNVMKNRTEQATLTHPDD